METIEELKSLIEELKRDKEIVDWIQKNGKNVAFGFPQQGDELFYVFMPGEDSQDDVEANNFRDVILAAMQKDKQT